MRGAFHQQGWHPRFVLALWGQIWWGKALCTKCTKYFIYLFFLLLLFIFTQPLLKFVYVRQKESYGFCKRLTLNQFPKKLLNHSYRVTLSNNLTYPLMWIEMKIKWHNNMLFTKTYQSFEQIYQFSTLEPSPKNDTVYWKGDMFWLKRNEVDWEIDTTICVCSSRPVPRDSWGWVRGWRGGGGIYPAAASPNPRLKTRCSLAQWRRYI